MIRVIAKREKISLEEVAKLMGRDSSSISSLITRFSLRYANCTKTQDLIEKTVDKARIPESQA